MLSAHNIQLNFGNRVILDRINFSLISKERIALVGENGAGKSSFLKILAGETEVNGNIDMAKNLRIGFLAQNPELNAELSVLETVRLGLSWQISNLAHHQALCEELALETDCVKKERLEKAIADLTAKIEGALGFDLDYHVEEVLSRLSIKARDEKIANLSGGERRRVDLARILLSAPDVFLLDEPTNHLDVFAIRFLIEFFSKRNSAVLFTSHDSLFVDELSTKIVELSAGKLFTHNPPYENYLEGSLVRKLLEERTVHKKERLMVGELAWLRAGTPARTTKQNARIDRAYELINEISEHHVNARKALKASTAAQNRLGNTILELEDISKDIDGRVLFRDFSLKVTKGQRYGIVGPNGCGKSTLLGIIASQMKPSSGQVILGKNTEFLFFDQQKKELNLELTLKETLANHGDFVHISGQNIHIATYLERYLFSPDDAFRKVETLSGGEKNRLQMAKLFRNPANCLLLDEPTNDLDVTSLGVLEELLLDFSGVVFVVSHDRRFLDKISNSIIAFEPDTKKLTSYVGNFSDYEKARLTLGAPLEVSSTTVSQNQKKATRIREKRRRSFKEEREFVSMEQLIDKLEKERTILQTQLSDGEFFKSNPLKINETIERLKEVELEIENLFSRWAELSEMDG